MQKSPTILDVNSKAYSLNNGFDASAAKCCCCCCNNSRVSVGVEVSA